MGIGSACNDVRRLVMIVIAVKTTLGVIVLLGGAMLLVYPSRDGLDDKTWMSRLEREVLIANKQNPDDHIRCTEKDCSMSLYHMEFLVYMGMSLANIIFCILLLIGVRQQKIWLCGLWMVYGIICATIMRAEKVMSIASFDENTPTSKAILTFFFGVAEYIWIGFFIWAVLKFINHLRKDRRSKSVGLYQNTSASLSASGPQNYVEHSQDDDQKPSTSQA